MLLTPQLIQSFTAKVQSSPISSIVRLFLFLRHRLVLTPRALVSKSKHE